MVNTSKDTMKEYHFEEDYNDILNTFWGLQLEREYLELPYDIWMIIEALIVAGLFVFHWYAYI